MCLEATREDEEHLLLSFTPFAMLRERFLATWIHYAILHAADSCGIVPLLIGGSTREDNSMVGHNLVGIAVAIQNLGLVDKLNMERVAAEAASIGLTAFYCAFFCKYKSVHFIPPVISFLNLRIAADKHNPIRKPSIHCK